MKVFLINEKYINALFISDYILHDPEVIADVYLSLNKTFDELEEPEIRQMSIGCVAELFNFELITSMNMKRMSGLIDSKSGADLKTLYAQLDIAVMFGCYYNSIFEHFRKNKKDFKRYKKKSAALKSFYQEALMKNYDKELLNKQITEELKNILKENNFNEKEYRFTQPQTYNVIAREFKMYKFETEKLRQDIYSLWLFVCDLPEIYCEYLKNTLRDTDFADNLTTEGMGRLLFYRRLVDVGCTMSPKEKLKAIKAYEF